MYISSTLVTHVVLVLMVSTKFLESVFSLIPFQRAGPTLVLECYVLVTVQNIVTNQY
jgi:hypothetical protein